MDGLDRVAASSRAMSDPCRTLRRRRAALAVPGILPRPRNAPSHTLTGAFPFPNESGPGGATNTVLRGLTATKERLMGNASAPVTDAPMGVDRGHR